MRAHRPLACTLAISAALLAACADNFEKQSQVTRLRVLGVQAEPAELILTPDGGLPATTLTALAIDPSGVAITARFSLCKLQGALPAPDVDCPGGAGLDLPDGGPLSARLDLNAPDVQAAALALLASDAGTGQGDAGVAGLLAIGLPILYGFELRAPAHGNPDGGPPPAPGFDVQRVIGLGTVTLRTATSADQANRNPQLRAVSADGVELAADGSSTLKAGAKVTLLPLPADDAKQPAGAGLEKLNFSFYATAGEVGELRSADTTATGQPGIASIDYTVPLAASGPVRLFVVVRDGRGGVGWLERRFTVAP